MCYLTVRYTDSMPLYWGRVGMPWWGVFHRLIAQGLGHEEFAIYCFINIIQHIGHNKHPFYRLVAAAKCTGSCNFPIKIFIHSVYRILYHIIEKKARGKSHFFLDKS